MNICLNAGGGLGDILRVYLSGQQGYPWCQPYWGQLEKWKEDTGGKIRLVMASHNPSAADFFRFVPWIDDIIRIPWVIDGRGLPAKYAGNDYTPMRDSELIELCKNYEWKQPKIYLSTEEEVEYNSIVEKPNRVLFYPFGGYGARLEPELYIPLIEKLCELGYYVIIVGDTHIRNFGNEPELKCEEFNYNHSNVLNLVGRNSCRLTCQLAFSSDIYIGSIGCYMHAAFGNSVKSTVLTCKEVWEDNSVFGSNILRNDSLWYLRRYVGMYEKSVDLVCIIDTKILDRLWKRIAKRMTSEGVCSEYLPWKG